MEKYSIDECFLDLTGITEDLTALCRTVRGTVRQWTGLPVGVGIAETKTLAKIANRIAKASTKTNGVLDLVGSPWRDKALTLDRGAQAGEPAFDHRPAPGKNRTA